jgi:CoA:oxalate CoA-transferase
MGSPEANQSGCLEGVRVIELARYQAGPRAGMIMSDMGAEVIKVEPLHGEASRTHQPMFDGQSIYFGAYNRGKKSLCLDLYSEQGKSVLADLVRDADFVLENFRPGTLEKMGFGYASLCSIKADIILLRVTAFGQYGPYVERPGFDPLGQALSGLMMLTGKEEGKPIGTAFSLVDRLTALHCAIGALGALRHRDRTGEGQVVDVCLMDAGLTTVEIPLSYYLSSGREDGEGGRVPHRALDGWVIIASGTDHMRDQLMVEINADPGVAGEGGPLAMQSLAHPVRQALDEWCASRTVIEICQTMERLGIVVAPVRSIPEVAIDPHLWEREMLVKIQDEAAGEMFVPGSPMKFSKSRNEVGTVASAGQHTVEVLRDLLGYEEEDIIRLIQGDVVAGIVAE